MHVCLKSSKICMNNISNSVLLTIILVSYIFLNSCFLIWPISFLFFSFFCRKTHLLLDNWKRKYSNDFQTNSVSVLGNTKDIKIPNYYFFLTKNFFYVYELNFYVLMIFSLVCQKKKKTFIGNYTVF